MQTRIYTYGCRAPITNTDLVGRIAKAAHMYRNGLVEIERERREWYVLLRSAYIPEVAEAEARVEVLDKQIEEYEPEEGPAVREHKALCTRRRKLKKELDTAESKPDRDRLLAEMKALKHAIAEANGRRKEERRNDGDTQEIRSAREERKKLYGVLKEERTKLAKLVEPADESLAERVAQWCKSHGYEPVKKKPAKKKPAKKKPDVPKYAPFPTGEAHRAVVAEMMIEEQWPEFWRTILALDLECEQLARDARHAEWQLQKDDDGQKQILPPGCYLRVEAAVKAAFKHHVPKFRSWRDSRQQIGVQLKATSVADVINGKSQHFQLVDDTRGPDKPLNRKGEPRCPSKKVFKIARIRVGSNKDASPVWAEFPVILHRPMPLDAKVLWAWVQLSCDSRGITYELQVTMSGEFEQRPRGAGAVAVDLGWRKLGDRVRVGYAVTDELIGPKDVNIDGFPNLFPPRHTVRLMDHVAELRSTADKHFDEAKCVTAALVGGTAWLGEAIAGSEKWHNHGRLRCIAIKLAAEKLGSHTDVALWQIWKRARLDACRDLLPTLAEATAFAVEQKLQEADGAVFWLSCWRRKDEHLSRWSADEREEAQAERKDTYRKIAARLARRFSCVVLADIDLSPVATRHGRKEGDDEKTALRVKVAPSELREAIRNAFGDHTVVLDAPDRTSRCTRCGHVSAVDGVEVDVTCPQCGETEDQDERAGINLLRAFERVSASQPPGPSRVSKEPETCGGIECSGQVT
jgi:hypothetical protein